jgi:hypothetical protein
MVRVEKLLTKSTFGLPPRISQTRRYSAEKKTNGIRAVEPDSLKMGISRTALQQDDYIFVDGDY